MTDRKNLTYSFNPVLIPQIFIVLFVSDNDLRYGIKRQIHSLLQETHTLKQSIKL